MNATADRLPGAGDLIDELGHTSGAMHRPVYGRTTGVGANRDRTVLLEDVQVALGSRNGGDTAALPEQVACDRAAEVPCSEDDRGAP